MYDVEDEGSEFNIVKSIVRCLKRFDELCVWLQTENPSEVKMSKVRFYFDKLLTEYPTLRRYLGRDLWDERDVDTAIARNYDVTRRDSDTPASTSTSTSSSLT
jgi:hypothetical protein